jgi:hypothetical protein
MTLDREGEIIGVHAAAVVDDANELSAAVLDRDVNARRAGVERILDKLLDRRSRTLDHLAGGDAVDKQRIETADGHGAARIMGSGVNALLRCAHYPATAVRASSDVAARNGE